MDSGPQRAGINAKVAAEALGPGVDIGPHDLSVELRVELQTPGALTDGKGQVMIAGAARQKSGLRRQLEHRLFVSDLVDLVTGLLCAEVSKETLRFLDERESARGAS